MLKKAKNILKSISPLVTIIFLASCNYGNIHDTPTKSRITKDTIISTLWNLDGVDTISGYAIHIVNGDTVIVDFGVNPNFKNKQ